MDVRKLDLRSVVYAGKGFNSVTRTVPSSLVQWMGNVASAYLAALWGSLAVILVAVGQPPTLDASRPGGALIPLAFVTAAASFLGRGTAGVSGAMAGTASAYALAIITGLRAAERNWAFIAPGPSSAWQASITDALLQSPLHWPPLPWSAGVDANCSNWHVHRATLPGTQCDRAVCWASPSSS
jgi:hypothetical protein